MFEFIKKINFGLLSSFGGNEGFVALDIGSSSIKMVESAVDKNGYRLLNVGILPLPATAVQNNVVVEPDVVVSAIRRLIEENGVKSTQVISAVPGRAVIMKKIQLPMQSEEELEANVEFEANNVIPENLENVNLDYQVLNYLESGGKIDVLLVAVKKDIVNSYTDVIEQAGLAPVIMDVDYFAMENMYEANYEPETAGGVVGLVQIGARYTSINVLSNGVSTFTGDLPVGGEEFTDSLKRELKVSAEAAETLKVTGLLEGKKNVDLETCLKPTGENLADEIRRTLSLYGAMASEEGEGIRAIYVSGGSARVPGLCALLEERLGVPVNLSEPFRGFNIGKNIDRNYLVESAPLFAVGAGLSIRRPGDK